MHIFSSVLTAVIGGVVIKNRHSLKKILVALFLITLVIAFVLNYGYFFKIGDMEILYEELCTGLLFFVACIYVLKGKYDKKILFWSLIFLAGHVIAVLFLLIVPEVRPGFLSYAQSWDALAYKTIEKQYLFSLTNSNLLIPARFFIYFVVLSVVKVNFTKEDWKRIFKWLFIVIQCYIVYGYLEWLIKNVFNFNISMEILNPFFGRGGSTYDTMQNRQGIAIQGFFREPSTYATALFYSGLLFCYRLKKEKLSILNVLWCVLTAGLLFLSGSFSGILYVALLFMLLMLLFFKRTKKTAIIYGAVALGVALAGLLLCLVARDRMSYYFDRILNTFRMIGRILKGETVSYHEVTSEYARFLSIYSLIQLFIRYFIFGMGYGTTWGHTALVWFLANGGLFGVVMWLKIVCKDFLKKPSRLLLITLFLSWFCTQTIMVFYSFVILSLLVYARVDDGEEIPDAPEALPEAAPA